MFFVLLMPVWLIAFFVSLILGAPWEVAFGVLILIQFFAIALDIRFGLFKKE